MKADSSKKEDENTQQSFDKQASNYAQALRLLKETEERLEKKKKQIKVDSMRAQRGKWHAQDHEKKTQLRKDIKEQSMKLQNQFSMMRAKQLQKIQHMKKQSERLRQQGLKKRSMSRLQSLQSKIRLNHEVREQSLHLTEKIIHFRQNQLEKKRQQRLSLYGSRKQSRMVYQQFQASRVSEVRISISRQRDELLKILNRKQKELNELQNPNASTSRLKIDKLPSTTQNLRSIDQGIKIYNPNLGKKSRKRSLSDYRFIKQAGSLITQI